jgi:hypothetical protein
MDGCDDAIALSLHSEFLFRPMEEQRERYGPALYTLTKLVLAIRLYLHVSLARYGQRKM